MAEITELLEQAKAESIQQGVIEVIDKAMKLYEAKNLSLRKEIKDARAKVREIKYHHTKPRASRHGNTAQTCLTIESVLEQSLKRLK